MGMAGSVVVEERCRGEQGARVALVARLRSRRGEIERAIFVSVSGELFERTGAEDREYMEGLRVAGEVGLEYVLSGVERWGRSLEPVPRALLLQAERAARAGVGLDTVLRRYVAAHAVLEDFVVWELEREDAGGLSFGAGGVLRGVLSAIAALVGRLIRVVSSAHNRETQRVTTTAAAATAAAVVGVRADPSVLSRGGERDRMRGEKPKCRGEQRALGPGGWRGGECLAYLASHPGSSNREVAVAIGIVHRSQISKLLSDLQTEGLVVKNSSARPGIPNQWRLTPTGEAWAQSLGRKDGRS